MHAPMSETAVPTAQPGPNKSPCQQCRARKVRCDRIEPSCGACRRLMFNCSFSGIPGTREVLPASDLTQAGTKRRRTLAACHACRNVNARCTGNRPCDRCKSRQEECIWDSNRQGYSTVTPEYHKSEEASPPFQLDPELQRCYIKAYFDGPHFKSCLFLHKPTILAEWSQGQLDLPLLKAICAAGRRIQEKEDPEVHDALVKAWVDDARTATLARLDRVTMAQIQTLVLVIQLRLQAGETVEAWNLVSLASRLAFTLRLNYERPDLDPVMQECRRRLIWAIYLLDRLFSSGIQDLAVCPSERVHVRLPCDDRSFEKGLPSRAEYIEQAVERADMDVLAYLIRLHAIRERILIHTKEVRRSGLSPLATADELSCLQAELTSFGASLPTHLQLTPRNLPVIAHSSDSDGFLMLHTIWLQCHCDLYRFLTPGIRESVSQAAFDSTPVEYIKFCQQECLHRALQLCDFWHDMFQILPHSIAEDLLFDVSVYQVSQILHHLYYLLPEDGPHSLENVRSNLERALGMATASHNRTSWVSDALKAARSIINRLGQVSSPPSEPSSENIHHLPSQGSFIPPVASSDKATPLDTITPNGSSAYSERERLSEDPRLGELPQIMTDKDMSAEEAEARVQVPWELFGIELSSFCEFNDYIPLLGA